MDKELLTKVNEMLKANGRQELSMEELGKMAGGVTGIERPAPPPFEIKHGVKCPNCGGTNTISINGDCHCFDCDT